MTTDAPTPADRPLAVTERDMLGALQVLELASEDPRVQLVLSDEEILALDGEESLRALGSPYLDQDAVHRETATATALRGLIARRMVNPTDSGREDEGELLIGEGDPTARLIQLERGLAGILTLRRIPEGMVVVERMASGVRTTLGLYVFAGGVLEEFVAADGLHHFTVPRREDLPARLAEFVDPHGTAREDGPVEEISIAQVTSLDGLEDTRSVATITCLDEGPARRATVFALSDRVRLVDNGTLESGEEAPEVQTLLAISDVSPASLREILGGLLPQGDAADAAG